jgi:hypothetical protein
MCDVISREIGLENGLVLAQFSGDVGASHRVRVVVGMVQDVPPRRPQGLRGGPIHIVIAAPRRPSSIGPGSYNRRCRFPAQRVQKWFCVFVLGQSAVIEGERVSPMVIIEKRGLGGRARAARGPVDRRNRDVGPGGREGGRPGGGTVGDRHGCPVGGDGNRRAGSHVDDKGDLAVVHQGRNGGIIHLKAIGLVGGQTRRGVPKAPQKKK